jgi:NodT family efflux transporter outer membrane factor (OMF) lipoprotein
MKQTLTALAVTPAFDQSNPQVAGWWHAFNDESLDGIVELALQGNPSLSVAQARLKQASQIEGNVTLDTGVRFDSEAAVVRQHLSTNGLFPPPMGGSTFNQGDISAGAAYTFDWWGKNHALLQAAVGERKAAEYEQKAAELLLAGEVVNTFFNWQNSIAQLKFKRLTVDSCYKALQLAQARLKRGLDSAQLSSQMEALWVTEQDNLKELESRSAMLRNRLAALSGNGPDWGAQLQAQEQTSAVAFPLPKKLPLDWLARRPDLKALRWRTESALERIEGARADFYPDVDLRLLAGLQTIDLSNWLSTKSGFASVGPAVHIPLFNGGTLRTRLSIRQAEYEEAVAHFNQALLAAANQVSDAANQVATLEARERLQHTATMSAFRLQQLQMERFSNGLSDRLAVVEADIAFFGQQARDAKVQADRNNAMAALFVALGGGFESSKE